MVSVKRAEFDSVHDIQKTYKKMLYALSYPGKIYNLSDIEANMNIYFDYNKSIILMALCVLDSEVSLCVFGNRLNNDKAKEYFRNITYTNLAPSEDACDYIIISGQFDLNEVIQKISCGTLIDPHESTTVFIEVDEIKQDDFYQLEGAGIKDKNYINPSGLSECFIDKRNEMCSQFPLGFDIILCDKKGNIAGIPRTTKITRRCV